VQIASLPIAQLQDQVNLLTQQQTAYQGLNTDVTNLSIAVENIQSALGSSSYSVNSLSTSVATAKVSMGAMQGSYNLTVLDPGSFTEAASNNGLAQVSDPSMTNIAAGTSFQLSVNGVQTTIHLATASLNALAKGINSANVGVNATIINIGSTSSPDYRLSLESTTTQNVPIDLTASDGTHLVTVQEAGSQACYQVNGQPPAGISSTTPNIKLAPGVTATIAGAGSTTITVGRDSSALGTALNGLVSAYNSALLDLSRYHGQGGGVLSGQSEVFDLESEMRNLINFTGGTGGTTSLTSLGLSFNDSGQLTFNSSALYSASMADIDTFFGDGSTPGFLLHAESVINGINDPVSGTLTAAINQTNTSIKNDNAKITSNQQQIATLQENLTQRMSKADAAIAVLEQQASYYTDLFSAMKQDAANITNS
jgi:flagellar hook-associated protein 2